MCRYDTCYSSVCAGAELYFPSVQLSDAGIYICTCQDQYSTNRSRAEIVVTSVYDFHFHKQMGFSLSCYFLQHTK